MMKAKAALQSAPLSIVRIVTVCFSFARRWIITQDTPSKKRLEIILSDKSPDLFPHENPMNIGGSKMETDINPRVYDLFVDVVAPGKLPSVDPQQRSPKVSPCADYDCA